MIFGILVHSGVYGYEDLLEEKYYLNAMNWRRATELEGRWVLYYRPTTARGRSGYFAVAKVDQVQPDRKPTGLYIAFIEPTTFLEFPEPVPLKVAGAYVEQGLLNASGVVSGRSRNSVRQIDEIDFYRILALGLPDIEATEEGSHLRFAGSGFTEDRSSLEEPTVRGMQLSSRVIRDRAFRDLILGNYRFRCALTGLRLSIPGDSGEKTYEAEAAHLVPVKDGGADARSNGIALSRTIHWAFDGGLLSLSDKHEILVSSQSNDPAHLRRMINAGGRMLLPPRKEDWPHPQYVRWHRTNCFKP